MFHHAFTHSHPPLMLNKKSNSFSFRDLDKMLDSMILLILLKDNQEKE